LNFFNAVFNRISARLQELSSSSEENPDFTDIELIQHINVDILRLIRLLTESIQKFKLLRKSAHIVLEFSEVQSRPNDELSKCCDTLFDILQDSFSDNKKSPKQLQTDDRGGGCHVCQVVQSINVFEL
ncbi:Uncharacterized protein OBRU01_07671, partial [Operophtera brumata]